MVLICPGHFFFLLHSYHRHNKDCTFIDVRTRNMKFVLVYMLVALCLCTGVLRTGAKNLRPRVLDPVDFCMGENEHCNKKKDCCEGFNCVGPFTHGSKTCQISHCIPEGK